MNLALMIPLAERTAVLVVAALLFTRVKAFRSLLNQRATYKDKAVMVLIFSGISILGTYNGIWYQDAIANSRVIGTIVAGLLAGPWVGLATGLVAGIHRYTLGGFTDLACAISTISEGVLAGLFYRFRRTREIRWTTAMAVGFVAEWMQMAIILLVARPYADALALVKAISVPMSVVNALGIAVLIIIIDLAKTEEDRIGALQAQRTMQVADKTLSYLRQGLTYESAKRVAEEILRTTRVAAVAITDTKTVLAHVGAGSSHHVVGQEITTKATREVLETKEVKIAGTKEEIGCRENNCTLRSAILVPLMRKRGEVAGVLKLYQDRSRKLSAVDLELVRGLGNLISTQLELADLEKQARLLADAEIKALHAQINPHFLFNALNTIVSFIRFRPEQARELLIHLGEYFRKNLHDSGGFVTLAEELEHIEAYLAIERARFGEKLKVEYEIEPGVDRYVVPGLVLQPLVENAIKHGLLPKREGGVVKISARLKDKQVLELKVADNGVGMEKDPFVPPPPAQDGKRRLSGIGLSNVRSRLQAIYGQPYGIVIDSKKGLGTTCLIELPLGVKVHAESVHRG
ncbi:MULTISPECIES: sensor histidine kinase [Brevibacillus]|jgi:two-component system sensor histidine kinase LytS|uniref:histidine kinase n=1 Tax=Brevibacillus borstelensis AK1 TaxID=1300222 RepID=M8DF23_9BACL|nr:sensor histidine kinase [Brevibacillus borstelensis]EMT52017.1 two-component sensor histidine kinase [Brevibacillus borstelensis AK1]MBE5394065.1 sensor histidine kinase [Brevibacillus borstelensis]MCC0565518.1 sensor histidine kinase [Brevibacillus borstelensis]MCM3468903.1 sensor histidine kinase [Brevibacillus borstelensis]MCM3559710.1 sensor histidine kinase [Brevibacillus borstelensis]